MCDRRRRPPVGCYPARHLPIRSGRRPFGRPGHKCSVVASSSCLNRLRRLRSLRFDAPNPCVLLRAINSQWCRLVRPASIRISWTIALWGTKRTLPKLLPLWAWWRPCGSASRPSGRQGGQGGNTQRACGAKASGYSDQGASFFGSLIGVCRRSCSAIEYPLCR